MKKGNDVYVWTKDTLTKAEQEAVIAQLEKVNGMQNSNFTFVDDAGAAEHGLVIHDTYITFNAHCDWSFIGGGAYTLAYVTVMQGASITNKYIEPVIPPVIPTKETVNVTVTKAWEGVEENEIFPEVTVKLFAGDADTGKTALLNAANNYTATFEGLDKYTDDKALIQYSVSEADVPEGYRLVGISGDMTNGFVITNKKIDLPELPKTADHSNPLLWTAVLVLSLGGLAVIYFGKKTAK